MIREKWDSTVEQIWQKFLLGDDESFDRLYSMFVKILFTYGLQFTSDRELVKDCIQDVFVTIYGTKSQLHHITNISVYFRISLKNRIINAVKKDNKHLSTPDFAFVDEFAAEEIQEYIEEEQHNRNRIETILKLLTPQQKKVVHYRYIEGLSLEEISILMKINYQSVQNTLQRAIKKIKKHFFSEK